MQDSYCTIISTQKYALHKTVLEEIHSLISFQNNTPFVPNRIQSINTAYKMRTQKHTTQNPCVHFVFPTNFFCRYWFEFSKKKNMTQPAISPKGHRWPGPDDGLEYSVFLTTWLCIRVVFPFVISTILSGWTSIIWIDGSSYSRNLYRVGSQIFVMKYLFVHPERYTAVKGSEVWKRVFPHSFSTAFMSVVELNGIEANRLRQNKNNLMRNS